MIANIVGNVAQAQFLSVTPCVSRTELSSKRVKSCSSPVGTDAELY